MVSTVLGAKENTSKYTETFVGSDSKSPTAKSYPTAGSLPVAILPHARHKTRLCYLLYTHHSQKTCFTLSGRSCPRYLKHHSNMIPPPLPQKKATPPSFFTAVQGKYQHPPIHGVALRRAGGKFKLAFWKSSRLAKGSSDLASEQYMSLNF